MNWLPSTNTSCMPASMMTGAQGSSGTRVSESIDEMKHADESWSRSAVSGRTTQPAGSGQLRIGETVEEMLRLRSLLEMDAIPDLKLAITPMPSPVQDFSHDLFQDILEDEEEHGTGWKPSSISSNASAGKLSSNPSCTRTS